MKIDGINTNKIINPYNDSKKVKGITRGGAVKDSIQISSIGKSLSSYSPDDKIINQKDKVESIKKALANGTYKVDAKLVAQKIIDSMKAGR